MKMLRRSALAALLALAVAACGGTADDADEPVGQALEPTPAPGLPVDDDAAAGGTYLALPPMRAVHEEVQDAAPRPFEHARYDETDGSFHVLYTTGVEPCYVLAGVEVVEESEQVTVTLLEGHLPGDDGRPPMCIEIAERVSTPVALDAPLDGRTVVDGATGEPVPVDVITSGDAASS